MIYLANILKTETGTEPVTLQEIKDWIGVDYSDHDGLLADMGKGARQTIERYCNIFLVEGNVTLDLELTGDDEGLVQLPYGLATSLLINELDTENGLTLLTDGTDYYQRGSTVRIWPGRYTVSYTVTPTVPQALKEAILMEVAERYAHRGENGTGAGISEAAKQKAEKYKVWEL